MTDSPPIAASPSSEQARDELQSLVDRRAPADRILASPCLQDAQAELHERPATIPAGVIPLRRFWRDRRYAENQTFEGLLARLHAKARRHAGSIIRQRRAVLVLGPPASGKSGAAELFACQLQAALIDADDAKSEIVEFDGGRGAMAVHHESGLLATYVLADAAKSGDNLVLPKVGGSPDVIEQLLRLLRGAGYEVVVAHVSVPFDEVIRRLAKRYLESGRIVDPDFVRAVYARSRQSFDTIRKKGLAHGWFEIDGGSPDGGWVDQGGTVWPDLVPAPGPAS